MLGLSVFRSHLLPGAVRQRHGVGGGAPVTFGRRRRCPAGPKISSAWAARRGRRKEFFSKIPEKISFYPQHFLMTIFLVIENCNKISIRSNNDIGGAPINKSRRRWRPKISGRPARGSTSAPTAPRFVYLQYVPLFEISQNMLC